MDSQNRMPLPVVNMTRIVARDYAETEKLEATSAEGGPARMEEAVRGRSGGGEAW
jgi:hypothetical protein